ncbi:hypothetical protein FGIG_06059 [Fasciola gigantica]|uniref:EF-hand domain-containing protein n=1 Tax=Fasciola gigantica TaxID=46835 RepID=A0A504YZB2_FASGI|nr:hypothetical protein FGIG_06059 [Fasciola gigantica]
MLSVEELLVLLPTEQMKEKILKIFENYDVNKDGQIDKEELINIMKASRRFDEVSKAAKVE